MFSTNLLKNCTVLSLTLGGGIVLGDEILLWMEGKDRRRKRRV